MPHYDVSWVVALSGLASMCTSAVILWCVCQLKVPAEPWHFILLTFGAILLALLEMMISLRITLAC